DTYPLINAVAFLRVTVASIEAKLPVRTAHPSCCRPLLRAGGKNDAPISIPKHRAQRLRKRNSRRLGAGDAGARDSNPACSRSDSVRGIRDSAARYTRSADFHPRLGL